MYHRLDVTHLLFASASEGADSYAGDLVFWDFAVRYTHSAKGIGGLTLARMPQSPPPGQPFGDVVAFFACRTDLANGLYHLKDLNLYPLDTHPAGGFPQPFEPAARGPETERQLHQADFLIYDTSCQKRLSDLAVAEFTPLTLRGSEHLHVRKTSP